MIAQTTFLLCFLLGLGTILAQTLEQDFMAWFKKHGGTAPKVSLQEFEGMGRGILALEDLPAGEEIFFIPSDIVFSLESLKASSDPLHKELARVFASDDQVAVSAAVLLEKFRGSESFYAPYINILPKNIPNLLQFTEEELSYLQHSELQQSALFNQKTMRETLDDFVETTANFWPQEYKITYQDWQWATSIVDSRGLRFRGKVYLAPFADMFNYSPHPDPRISSDGEFFLKHHILAHDGLRILSDRKQMAGNQVFEDYGDNTDMNYLMYHGFVANENPFRCIKTVGPHFVDIDNDKALEFVQMLQFKSPPSRCIDESLTLGKPLEVYLTALSMRSNERKRCMKLANVTNPNFGKIYESCGFREIHDFLTEYMKTLNTQGIQIAMSMPSLMDATSFEMRTFISIKNWIEGIYPNYPTSLSDDMDLLTQFETLHNDMKTNMKTNMNMKTNEKQQFEGDILSLEHKIMAIRYRMKMKSLWLSLCGTFQATCFKPGIKGIQQSEQEKALEEKAMRTDPFDTTDDDSVTDVTDRVKLTLEQKIDIFNHWFSSHLDHFTPENEHESEHENENENEKHAIHKIKASTMPVYRIGTIATEDIKAESIYLQVPIDIIIDNEKAMKDEQFRPFLLKLQQLFNGQRDHFHELLFYLMYLRFIQKDSSIFWPYIDLLPNPNELDVPSLWSSEDLEDRLRPSFIFKMSHVYRERMSKMFESILKIEIIKEFFPKHILTFDTYRWAYIILDSRSIWWNGERHLVPMLDFINCRQGPITDNNNNENNENNTNNTIIGRVHSTMLNENGNVAETRAGWGFNRGEQLFENYGQPNHIYFQYHGFSLGPEDGGNENDCVHFEVNITREEGMKVDWKSPVANDIIQSLRLSQAVFMTCLDGKHFDESLWKFMALKTNTFSSLEKRGQLGQPSPVLMGRLLSLVQERLVGYDSYTSRHRGARKFIRLERDLLRKVEQRLTDMMQHWNSQDLLQEEEEQEL